MVEPALLITSVQDGHNEARLTVRGDIDVDAIDKVRHHLEALLRGNARFIVVDLAAAPNCDSQMLAVLSRTQRRLSKRMGMISVIGLRPDALPAAVAPLPDSTAIDWLAPASA